MDHPRAKLGTVVPISQRNVAIFPACVWGGLIKVLHGMPTTYLQDSRDKENLADGQAVELAPQFFSTRCSCEDRRVAPADICF